MNNEFQKNLSRVLDLADDIALGYSKEEARDFFDELASSFELRHDAICEEME